MSQGEAFGGCNSAAVRRGNYRPGISGKPRVMTASPWVGIVHRSAGQKIIVGKNGRTG